MNKYDSMKRFICYHSIFLVFIYLLVFSNCGGYIKNDCTNYYIRRHQLYLELLKQHMDSAEIKYHYDKKYNVKLFYPDFFYVADTCAGSACFKYFNIEHRISLKMSISSSLVRSDVEKAVNYQIYLSDSSLICTERGDNYYIMKGIGCLKKCFLIDSNWIEYTLSYDRESEELIGKLIDLMKEWEPRASNGGPSNAEDKNIIFTNNYIRRYK